MVIINIAIVVLLAAVLALLIWLISNMSAGRQEKVDAASILQQQIEALRTAQERTAENLQNTLAAGQTNVTTSLQSSQKVLGMLNSQIGELQGTNKQMLEMGQEVRRLQMILASPKLRGNMGEWSLENLLSQVLPRGSYQLQYGFRDGQRVDALVQMNKYTVPIDAKFPLPSFEAMMKEESNERKTKLRRQLINDVIKHIDKIADNYIRPVEGTLDFAIMYIPAENVYYETVVKHEEDTKDILEYALGRKVIPVSPNLLYMYLMTVVMGLQGLRIEKQADEILKNLKKLNADFADFLANWDVLGKHIKNTGEKYDEGCRKIERLGMALNSLQENNKEEQDLTGLGGVD